MTRLSLVAAWALVFASAVFGQAGGRTGDPISGSWGTDGVTYLELKYNLEGAVTGTTIWREGGRVERARIAKGTFDSETGTLKLAGQVKNRDGETTAYVIEGRLAKGTLAGTYHLGADAGEFKFTRQ